MNQELLNVGLRALADVRACFPGAILAGGFLRDVILGREPKDIDIFVPCSLTADPGDLDMVPMRGAAEYMEQTEVDDIWDVRGYELPVQVIMLAPDLDPVERARAHDFGICQVWHDGEQLHHSGNFERDVMAKTFTLCICEDKKEFTRSMRRWERLRVKFPEFTLVVPESFAVFNVPATGSDA